MYNAEKPNLDELPTTAQLVRSTIIAVVAAIVILVTIVLPSEYGIDPTGFGRATGLAEMGEIKKELSEEAKQDHSSLYRREQERSVVERLFAMLVGTANAQTPDKWKDEVSFELAPGKTNELKLKMKKGAVATYEMVVEGGRVNFDLHAHGKGQSKTYEKGRGSRGSKGQFTAAFDGNHGWFWRNRDKTTLKVILKLRGGYDGVK